jgi:hypothetical protein
LTVSGVTPGQLGAVSEGAPVHAYVAERLAAYRDAAGDWWLGLQQQSGSGVWPAIQPVTGPLAPAGLQFTFYDTVGNVTSRTDEVGRIEVALRARTERLLWMARQFGTASIVLQVALRNNRRS